MAFELTLERWRLTRPSFRGPSPGSGPWVASTAFRHVGSSFCPKCLYLKAHIQVLAGGEDGEKGERNPTNGVTRQRAVLCLWNHWQIGCEEELRPRRIRERPWTWESVTPGLYTQLAHSKPAWPETSYLISLGLCFVTSKYELIPVFQGRRDQVMEHMEKYLVQSRQSVTVRASSLQFAQSQPCYP